VVGLYHPLWFFTFGPGARPRARTGPGRDRGPEVAPPTLDGVRIPAQGRRSAAVAAQLAARLVELVADLPTQEHDCGDDRQGDEGHEEDVLHQAGAPLVLREPGLQPGLEHEEVHGAPFGCVSRAGCARDPTTPNIGTVCDCPYHPQWVLTFR